MKALSASLILILAFFTLSCSRFFKSELQETGQQDVLQTTPLPSSPNPKSPSSEPFKPSAELVAEVESEFQHLPCLSALRSVQNLDTRKPQYLAAMSCRQSGSWSQEDFSYLNEALKKIHDQIEIMKGRNDLTAEQQSKMEAVSQATDKTYQGYRQYFQKLDTDLKLAQDFQKQMGCTETDHPPRMTCPIESLGKLEKVFTQSFAGVNLEALPIYGLLPNSELRNHYRPYEIRQNILLALSEILKSQHPKNFMIRTSEGEHTKQSTLSLWTAMSLESLLDRAPREADQAAPKILSSKEVKIIMANINLLGSNGNAWLESLHKAHNGEWLDIQFLTAKGPIRQFDSRGGRVFVRLDQPLTLENLLTETQVVGQISGDLRDAFAQASSYFPGELTVWLENTASASMDENDGADGTLNLSHTQDMIATLKALEKDKTRFADIKNLAAQKGKILKIQIGMTSSLQTPFKIERADDFRSANVLRLSFEVTRQTNWDFVLTELQQEVLSLLSN